MIVAMDGPAGTGKGTISKLIAQRLQFIYIDTGAMYRAVTLKMLEMDIKPEELFKIKELLENTTIDFKNELQEKDTFIQRVYLDGRDVTEQIRMPRVNECVSPYSAVLEIRKKMVEWQRRLANGKNVIMEGRDITTVVFPNADVKIYLTADVEERAKRRFKELQAKNVSTTFEEVLQNVQQRDDTDMHKAYGALKIADDAIVIDTTFLSIEEVYEEVKKVICQKESK